ncbi:MAG: hypothetical protein UY96_C0015G0009 [Parcubacteria group bacterium GW2011_GWB1_56_8]|nr:MAG: hypothetical protein UY96_C0015G0009 [Parcubacteria group bacterium GW2011_GWB1_56_8]
MNVVEVRQADWNRTATAADNTIVTTSEAAVSNARHRITSISALYDDSAQVGTLRMFGLEVVNGVRGYVGAMDLTDTAVLNLTTNVFTFAGHGLTNTDKVVYHNGGGTSVTGLTSGTMYFVVGVSGDDFQLSLTEGGAAIDLSGTQANFGAAQFILKKSQEWAVAGSLSLTLFHPLVGGVGVPVNTQLTAIASTQGFVNLSGYTKS